MGNVQTAIPSLGFDVNQPLSTSDSVAFKEAGYDFAIRYIPRTSALIAGNLTAKERESILAGGLNLMVVQHVALPNWEPTDLLGAQYGHYAVAYANQIELPKGINMWLDLEGVSNICAAQDVIAYCKEWYAAVDAGGWIPGIYCGWQTGLTDQQLYSLPFKHYWRAYNCDQNIPVRGYQIVQSTEKKLNGITFDPNTISADHLGDLPVWLIPS